MELAGRQKIELSLRAAMVAREALDITTARDLHTARFMAEATARQLAGLCELLDIIEAGPVAGAAS